MSKYPFEMDLQLFAEREAQTSEASSEHQNTEQENAEDNSSEEKKEQTSPKTYTEEEVESLKKQIEKSTQEAVEKAKKDGMSEAERLKLSEKERQEEQQQKILEELQSLRVEKQRSELKAEATKLLEKQGMGSDFAEMVMADTAENIQKNVQTLKATFDKAVEDKVKERMAGTTPATGNSGNQANSVQSAFEKALQI